MNTEPARRGRYQTPLRGLIEARFGDGRWALEQALRPSGLCPSICWYPSAGNCFRDLWAWSNPGLGMVGRPKLFIHTDYRGFVSDIDPSDPNAGRMVIEERHELVFTQPIRYEVSSDHAARAGLANPEPQVELLVVSLDTEQIRVRTMPVLYFYFENINWFEAMVFDHAVKFSHLFKRREGCDGGGARASVMNLFPYLALGGCRHLLTDAEVQIDYDILKRIWGRHHEQIRAPFRLSAKRLFPEKLVQMKYDWADDEEIRAMHYFRLHHIRPERVAASGLFNDYRPLPGWAEMELKKVTAATPWDAQFKE